jgi:zinc transport system permease protein
MADFYFYLLLSFFLAIAAGTCSSLSLWQRSSNAGDAFSHFLSLAIVISIIMQFNLELCLIMGLVSFVFINKSMKKFADNNNSLAMISAIALALSTILSALYPETRVDFMSLLFGDIISANYSDIAKIACFDLLLIMLMQQMSNSIKLYFINPEMAKINGVNTNLIEVIVNSCIMIFILIMIKIIGTIMMIGLIIFPAIIAKKFSKSAEIMIFISVITAFLANIIGLSTSFYWDIPAGPAIVLSMFSLLLISSMSFSYFKHFRK